MAHRSTSLLPTITAICLALLPISGQGQPTAVRPGISLVAPPLVTATVRYYRDARPELSRTERREGSADKALVSPDGEIFLLSYGSDSKDQRSQGLYSLYAFQIRTGMQIAKLRGTAPAFSSDSRRLYYSSDGFVHSLNLETGSRDWSTDLEKSGQYSSIRSIWHAPFAREVFVLRSKHPTGWELAVLDEATGGLKRTLDLPPTEGTPFVHEVSADGKYYLGSIQTSGYRSVFISETNGNSRTIKEWKIDEVCQRASFVLGLSMVAVLTDRTITLINLKDDTREMYPGMDYASVDSTLYLLTPEGILERIAKSETKTTQRFAVGEYRRLFIYSKQFLLSDYRTLSALRGDSAEVLIRPYVPPLKPIFSSPIKRSLFLGPEGEILEFRYDRLGWKETAQLGADCVSLGDDGFRAFLTAKGGFEAIILKLDAEEDPLRFRWDRPIRSLGFSDGIILTGHTDGTIGLASPTGQPVGLLRFGAHSYPVLAILPERRNPGFCYTTDGLSLKRWDIRNKKLVSSLALYDVQTMSGEIGYVSNHRAMTEVGDDLILIGDWIVSKSANKRVGMVGVPITAIGPSDKSGEAVSIDNVGIIRLHTASVPKGTEIGRGIVQGKASDIRLEQGWVIVRYEDDSIRFYPVTSSGYIAFMAWEREFAVWNEKFLFDGSSGIDSILHFRSGFTTYAISQFARALNRPDILWAPTGALGEADLNFFKLVIERRKAKDRAATPIPSTDVGSDMIPECRIKSASRAASGKDLTINFSLSFFGAPTGGYRVLVNGVQDHTRAVSSDGMYSTSVRLCPGANEIEIEAYSSTGSVSFRERVYEQVANTDGRSGLYLIYLANDDYSGSALGLGSLLYAEKDAVDLARFMETARSNYSRIVPLPFLGTAASKESLETIRATLASARIEDVVVVYLAGHGAYFEGEYYFLTRKASDHGLPGSGIRFEEIVKVISESPPRSKLVILDTCQSGERTAFDVDPSARARIGLDDHRARGLSVEKTASLQKSSSQDSGSIDFMRLYSWKDISSNTGVVVLSSSGGREYSYEPAVFDSRRNGLFMDALLKALKSDTSVPPRFRSVAETTRLSVQGYTKGLQTPRVDRDNAYFDILMY